MSSVNCYISYSGSQHHYDILLTLISKIKTEMNFLVSLRLHDQYLNDLLAKTIEKSDVFIIFGSKSYFLSETAIQEFNYAIEHKRKILFLNSLEIEDLLESKDDNEEIRKIKNYAKLMKSYEAVYVPPDTFHFGRWYDETIREIKNKILDSLKKNNLDGTTIACKKEEFKMEITYLYVSSSNMDTYRVIFTLFFTKISTLFSFKLFIFIEKFNKSVASNQSIG